MVRSRAYVGALVLAALVGVPVAAVAYGFLALVAWLQEYLFTDLPVQLGFATAPIWWALPLVGLSGFLTALCIRYLPGNSGHSPADGFATGGPPRPIELPGVFLAALATLSLGAVLGPEAPLIALGGGLGGLAVRVVKKDAPPTAIALIATAGSFAAISTLLGSPLLGAFLLMEAAGLGGAMLAVALLPGLLAAGIGSLVFVGIDSLTGLGTFSLAIPDLPPFTTLTGAMFGWAILFGLTAPLLAWATITLARAVRPAVHAHRVPVTTLLGLAVAGLAIAFSQVTGKGIDQVLFSGQDALGSLITQSATWSIGALALLVVCKVLAYSLSLSAFRGGPVFPSMFIGAALGVMAANLPGLSLVPAVGMGIGAMCASMLKLPFTSALLATVLLTSDGYTVVPLVIVAVVVAFVAGQWLPPIPTPAGPPRPGGPPGS
ncbi:chloride channel protein [Pengzhenrongella frigida]|uniref:Chloride channel protein n=1 Tax=Pengzhenrongella frigida TaxID=1259133 RepID=A0A4Q5MZX2_9MICO|nr:chloride channel protein [Cellulomonas sp. HLT2-17]RYV51286.1 chloride channel protein [Cellulomonas sp. HLT2-17]